MSQQGTQGHTVLCSATYHVEPWRFLLPVFFALSGVLWIVLCALLIAASGDWIAFLLAPFGLVVVVVSVQKWVALSRRRGSVMHTVLTDEAFGYSLESEGGTVEESLTPFSEFTRVSAYTDGVVLEGEAVYFCLPVEMVDPGRVADELQSRGVAVERISGPMPQP